MYDIVSNLLRPYTLLLVIATVTMVSLLRKRADTKRRFRFLATSILTLWPVSTPAVSYFALGTLEWPYPPSRVRPKDVQTIVILSGYLRPSDELRTWDELGKDSMYRCVLGADIYHNGEPCLVVVSGGVVTQPDGTAVSEVMAEFLVELRVNRDDIVIENNSTSTYENARNVAKLLELRGIRRVLLVTHATHLLRSEMCFHKQGIEVIPRGAYYRATQFGGSVLDFLPSASSAAAIDEVVHEWLGIAWYWVKGRI